MTKTVLAACLNEWMRRYIEAPKRFDAEFQTVRDFLEDQATGGEERYGLESAEYLERIASDLGFKPAGSEA
jgi:uncharacterized protein (DUF2267 family)